MKFRNIIWAVLLNLMVSGSAGAVGERDWPGDIRPGPLTRAVFVLDDILMMIAIQLIITALTMVLAPKPQREKPPAAQDWQNPTAEAGRPMPVIFGTITMQSPNILWYGRKSVEQVQVNL